MTRRLTLLALLLALAAPAWAAGTVTTTTTQQANPGGLPETQYALAWTSDASGVVSGTGTVTVGRGRIVRIALAPGSGATQPTDLYDVTILNRFGNDILTSDGVARGADLSNTTTKELLCWPVIPIDASGTLVLGITNSGNAKTGTVWIWVER